MRVQAAGGGASRNMGWSVDLEMTVRGHSVGAADPRAPRGPSLRHLCTSLGEADPAHARLECGMRSIEGAAPMQNRPSRGTPCASCTAAQPPNRPGSGCPRRRGRGCAANGVTRPRRLTGPSRGLARSAAGDQDAHPDAGEGGGRQTDSPLRRLRAGQARYPSFYPDACPCAIAPWIALFSCWASFPSVSHAALNSVSTRPTTLRLPRNTPSASCASNRLSPGL